MRKVKCWLIEHDKTINLVCDEPTENEDYVECPKFGTWGKKTMFNTSLDTPLFKVIASNNRGFQPNVSFLPEYVVEAYRKGIRDFEIIYNTRTETKEELRYGHLGLLQVTYDQSKKQNFTRAAVIKILGGVIDNPEKWLNNYEIENLS